MKFDSLLREFLPRVHVGILRAMESRFQLLQLFAGKSGPTPSLLPLERDTRLTFRVGVIAATAS